MPTITTTNPIESAREYVRARVLAPALSNASLDKSAVNEARNANQLLDKFERVGDLLIYLQRFRQERKGAIFSALRKAGLETFEDIIDDFEAKYSASAGSATNIQDFVVGQLYDIFTIHIFARRYDPRSGGMFVIGNKPNYQYAIVKATFEGGRYVNEWIKPQKILKYYLKSIKHNGKPVFGVHYKENAAIIQTPNLPILVFTRQSEGKKFTYEGLFAFADLHTENDTSKWFELEKVPHASANETVDFNRLNKELENEIRNIENVSNQELDKRLAVADKKPKKIVVISVAYERNPFVIAAVLRRASGICEKCNSKAPFVRAKNLEPYLEVHHKVRLADDGDDSVENAIAVCPNCHRQMHFGVHN